MENFTSFKTAQILKEAGFPQPEIKTGQCWYRFDGALFVVVGKTFADGRYQKVFYFGAEAPTEKEVAGFSDCFFAPTSADILREIYPAEVRGQIGAGDMLTMALDPEKAAERWMYDVGLVEKKHPLYDEWVRQTEGPIVFFRDGHIVRFAGQQCLCNPCSEGAKLIPVSKDGDIGLGPGIGGVVTLIKLPGSSTVVASLDVSNKVGCV